MSLATVVFAGFLFVDDTDLIAVGIDRQESPQEVTARMQAAVNA
jgi:roadblock/LC7 domain-containing protein